MSNVAKLQQTLLNSESARAEFSKDPQAFLRKHNVTLPPGTKLPDKIPLSELNNAAATVEKHLGKQDLAKIKDDPAAVSKFVKSAFPAKAGAGELDKIKEVMSGRAHGIANAADAATIAVVVAVVAVPVAVFGVSAGEEEIE